MSNELYTAILSWPMNGVNPQSGRLEYSENEQSINECLLNIMLTSPGERIMRPEFGAGLMNFIHQPNNLSTRQMIARTIRDALERWEPRIRLDSVNVVADDSDAARINIELKYQSLLNNNQYSLQFQMNLSG